MSLDSHDPPKKRRKLRPPGDAFELPVGPRDDPNLHDGRTRSSPHIEGQWMTHLYLELEAVDRLRQELDAVVATAKACHSLENRIVHSQVATSYDDALHLSLSKPLQLWNGQKTPFLSSVRSVLRSQESLTLSMAALDYLQNEDKSRTFLVCEVGYGYEQLSHLTRALNAVLEKDHLPSYYSEPRFHVSLAWWLTDPDKPEPDAELLRNLEEKHGKEVRRHQIEVRKLHVKMRNDVAVLQFGK